MKIDVKRLVTASMLLALAVVLAYVFHIFQLSGLILLPLHIPVLLCGLICGWRYGAICGAATPFLAMLVTSSPPLIVACAMAVELCVYGIVSGLMHKKWSVYPSLIVAMVVGRLAGGAATAYIFIPPWDALTFSTFIAGYFVTPAVGIYIQLVFIPIIMTALEKAKLVKTRL